MRLVAILLSLSCLFDTFQAISAHPISSSPDLQIIPIAGNGDTYLQSISQPLGPTEIDQLDFNSVHGDGCISLNANPRLIRNGVYITNAEEEEEEETPSDGMLCKKGFIGLAFKGAKMMVKSGATDAAIKGVGQVAKALGKRDVDENEREGRLVFLRRSLQQQIPFEKRGFAAFKSLKSFKSFGKIFKGFGGKASGALGAAGNVAMVASVATPLLASAPKAAAAESAAVAKTAAPKGAAPASSASTKPKPKPEPKKEENTAASKGDKEKTALPSSENEKREVLQEVEVLPQRRGTVSTTAGQVVTGLMVLGLGKQFYNAVAPKLQSHHQTPSQPPPQMYQHAYPPPQTYSPPMYANGQAPYYSSSGFNSRSLATSTEVESNDGDLLGKRSVMDAASHFVTVGFAVQAIQDNFKPIVREMGRLEHKGLHEARKYMGGGKQVQQGGPPPSPPSFSHGPGPRGYYQRRELHDSEEKGKEEEEQNPLLTRRGAFGNAMNHPAMHKMMNGANYLVTLSMLTGLAGQYVDSGIAKAKEKTHSQPQPQLQPGRMRRSFTSIDPRLIKRTDVRQPSDDERPNIEEEDGDTHLEKRVDLAGVGKFVSQAANSKIGKTAIKMAGFLI